jgi:tetratricopeptide (TPR) repeat protein
MKIYKMKNSILVGTLILSSLAFGQKKNETSAAVEFKNKFAPAFQSQDYETAKKAILSAKEFIDLAAEHPDTKESAKTLYYKGEVYLGIMSLSMASEDKDLTAMATPEFMEQGVLAFKQSFVTDKKYKSDITNAVYRARLIFDKSANEAYTSGDFKSAASLYNWQAKYSNAIEQLDSNAVFYSSVCSEKAEDYVSAAAGYLVLAKAGFKGPVTYNLASGSYRKAGNIEKAKSIISEGRKIYPNDRDLLLELVNINIDANDPEGAEAALAQAIAADPNNKQLFYTIGTIYIEMKDNKKAEESLMKALKIDPDYLDAQYQLGAHLVSWAGDLKTEANGLKLGDYRYDVLLSESKDTYIRAVAPLENYIAKQPNDKAVLNILFQLHRSLGNRDKAAEFKTRYEAAN